MGNQTLLCCLFPLPCVQSGLPPARLRRSDTLGGWPLARQAVGAGLSARGKATGKERLSPARGAKPPCFSPAPWASSSAVPPMLWFAGPLCRPRGRKPIFHPQGEALPSHTIRRATVFILPAGCFKDHTFTPNSLGSGEGGPGRSYQALLCKRRRGLQLEHRVGN